MNTSLGLPFDPRYAREPVRCGTGRNSCSRRKIRGPTANSCLDHPGLRGGFPTSCPRHDSYFDLYPNDGHRFAADSRQYSDAQTGGHGDRLNHRSKPADHAKHDLNRGGLIFDHLPSAGSWIDVRSPTVCLAQLGLVASAAFELVARSSAVDGPDHDRFDQASAAADADVRHVVPAHALDRAASATSAGDVRPAADAAVSVAEPAVGERSSRYSSAGDELPAVDASAASSARDPGPAAAEVAVASASRRPFAAVFAAVFAAELDAPDAAAANRLEPAAEAFADAEAERPVAVAAADAEPAAGHLPGFRRRDFHRRFRDHGLGRTHHCRRPSSLRAPVRPRLILKRNFFA